MMTALFITQYISRRVSEFPCYKINEIQMYVDLSFVFLFLKLNKFLL